MPGGLRDHWSQPQDTACQCESAATSVWALLMPWALPKHMCSTDI
jgi:hypothetical protein